MPGKKGTGFGNCVFAGLALCCVVMLLSPPPAIAASADTDAYSFVDTYSLASRGGELSEQEAQQLEEELKTDPENPSGRIQLLGYYSGKQFGSDDARRALQEHILWIIQHHPDSEIAGSPWASLDPLLDGESFYQAKELWLLQVKEHDEDAKVIANAASFFLIPEEDIAEELLKQGQSLEPDNPYWPKRLGFLYMLKGRYSRSLQAPDEMMQKALEQYEMAASLMDARERASLLSDLANAAFGAGDLEKAESYALELLEKAGTKEGSWSYGNAVHDGNIVLGRIAIRQGEIERAGDRLLKAGATPGSPNLNSFGPDFILAKELLEKGEKKTVTEYLRLCKNFWKEDVLDRWIDMIENGIKPDFEGYWFPDD